MSENDAFRAVVAAFRDLSIAELTNAVLGSPVSANQYAALSEKERAEETAEIAARAEKIAVGVAETLKRRHLLDGSAKPGEVNAIYREVLARFSEE